MGGDSFFPPPSSDEESLLGDGPSNQTLKLGVSRDENRLSCELDNDFVIIDDGESIVRQSPVHQVRRISSISEAMERQKVKVYADVMRSYEEFESRIGILEEAKSRILSYRPGSWAVKAGGMNLNEHVVPPITSLLLIGPKSSGKSSLINKISRVFNDDVFALGRAQVSHNSSTTRGTYFLHEYTIPRGSGSFCLYDTRSLSTDSSENTRILKRWMTKGVCHGELIKRKSDIADLKTLLKYKDRGSRPASQFRDVNFVIFVVNALSVLESMDGDDEKKGQFSQIVASNFNNPLLSFKDDKPVLVVTHGDLLPHSDRVRIRVYLGDMLGIPPTAQIFDIPEKDDVATQLAILDMLIHCLERADRNLPSKDNPVRKHVTPVPSFVYIFLIWVVLLISVGFQVHNSPPNAPPPAAVKAAQPPVNVTPRPVKVDSKAETPTAPPQTGEVKVDWHKIRYMWAGEDEDMIDWRKIRHLWLVE